jgi:DNA modification methylase
MAAEESRNGGLANFAPVYDMSAHYTDFVPFTANANYPVHRWYRYKEGFSRDLIHLILGSLDFRPDVCLDPFAGTGTTALACQEVGIVCHSIEVNPFAYHVASAKLRSTYTVQEFDEALRTVKTAIAADGETDRPVPVMQTLSERPELEKWLYSKSALQAILALRHFSEMLNGIYADLFLVIIAAILSEVGNTTKDGKCVRYKKGWQDVSWTRDEVYSLFVEKANEFRADILSLQKRGQPQVENVTHCTLGSALVHIPALLPNSVDIVITSPPYLNTFDYTDVYMPELWALGFVSQYSEVRKLRESTLRSHVQIKWSIDQTDIPERVKTLINEISIGPGNLWNDCIPDMIAGYFLDMTVVLREIKRVLRPGGRLCLVVGTSAYNHVTVETDVLLTEIAESLGFTFEEIRIIRNLKRSTKQQGNADTKYPPLRETLVILRA